MSEEKDLEKPYDAGDPKDVRERISKAKRIAAANQSVVRQIMGSSEGRDWIYQHLSLCHVYSTSFSTNALSMAFAEGERSVGLRLMADLVQAAPERYLEMLAEKGEKNV